MVIIIAAVVIVLAAVFTNIRIVPQAEAFVIERLGQYRTTWNAGIHVKMPFIDRIAKKVTLKEQVQDFPPQPVITKDNVTMQVDSLVFMTIMQPKLYTYGIDNPVLGVRDLAATTLRNIIGEMELDETLTGRDRINAQMQLVLDEATDAWGIKVTRVEIKNIQVPEDIEEVMSKQMRAERERRQTVLEAQAHQEAVVARAEGDKRAKILAAEAERDAKIALAQGQAESMRIVSEAQAQSLKKLSDVHVAPEVLRLKGIEAMKDISNGRATKIFMPSDITSAVSSLGVAGEALGIGDFTKIDRSAPPEAEAPVDPCIGDETSAEGKLAAETTAGIIEDVSMRGRTFGKHENDEHNQERKESET